MYKDINKILVVDDNEILVQSIDRHLRRRGFKVSVAFDGKVAQDIVCEAKLVSAPFEVVISDIVISNIDGFEFVPWLNRTFPECPVILISGFGNGDKIKDMQRPGIDFFHQKPVLPQDIMDSIQKINICNLAKMLSDDESSLNTLSTIDNFYILHNRG